jgi:HSP20 family protein
MDSHFNQSALNNIRYPRVNIQNKEKEYIYEFDLAGVDKKNIKLSIDENNVLTLEGVKKKKRQEKSNSYVKQEIFYGSFQRVMKLPDDIDQNKLETRYRDGILTLSIGKKKLKKPKAKLLKIQ